MSLIRLILASFLHHRRTNLAVALGAAVGTAVLTGALVVGDSMRGSLRTLALDRLGKIDEVLAPGRFFREKLADELKETEDFKQYGDSLVPAILLDASLENPNTHTRANHVQLIGCNENFYDLFLQLPSPDQPSVGARRGAGVEGREDINPISSSASPSPHPNPLPKGEGIALSLPLAEKLGVHLGDEILLRLPKSGLIPSDSALGEKRNTIETHRLTVQKILPPDGPARFALKSNQQSPLNAFVPLCWLQDRLEQQGKVNALLLSLNEQGKAAVATTLNPTRQDGQLSLTDRILNYLNGTQPVTYISDNAGYHPLRTLGILKTNQQVDVKLEDAGIHAEITPNSYLNLTSNRMIFDSSILSYESGTLSWKILCKQTVFQPVFSYLANSISDAKRAIPYSMVAAIDFENELPSGPFLSQEGKPLPPLGDHEIALNSYGADEIDAVIGDPIKISYFDPENRHGEVREKTAQFKLAAIVKLEGAANDRNLIPKVKGITDELTMADWDPPFPFDAKKIRPQDEKYWNEYGPTPKAFISLSAGRKLWGSRFGQNTSVRIAPRNCGSSDDVNTELAKLKQKAEETCFQFPSLGFSWQPVKLQALAAAEGTTPFNVLFLAFSFFIIASALMLVSLLFKLGIERRATEIGILLAVGWKPKQVRRLLFREGVLIALAGGLLGAPLGIAYAALMLYGLQTWWIDAISSPFLTLHLAKTSLAIGFLVGFGMATLAIYIALRKITRLAPKKLLTGQIETHASPGAKPTLDVGMRSAKKSLTIFRRIRPLDILCILFLLANVTVWCIPKLSGKFEVGIFFGSGMSMLVLSLLVLRSHLRHGAMGAAIAPGRGNLLRLALRNAARNPGRSVITTGLVASACFLIVSVSAFRLDPTQQTPSLASGNGGFALVAESTRPIFQNLDTPDGRAEIGFSDEEEKVLADCRFYSLRVRAGDDASCLNLYKPRSPRMLGLSDNFLKRGGFAWADVPKADIQNPWDLLETADRSPDDPIPVILEKNTANYSLQLWGGLDEKYEYQATTDQKFPLQVAALLNNSIFQGDLLVSEDSLLEKFPETTGYRYFLIECPPEVTAEVQKVLESRLGDYGFDAETTGRRLARFLAVQNTYLSTFQSLGGLGLLLGTLGLAAVQLRNILERRGELALLRAVGFTRKKLARLVFLENAVLLVLGLGVGILSAAVAVMPHFLSSGASMPWLSLAVLLALVLLVGLASGAIAARKTLSAPLLQTLRDER
jgi:ABC-type antimicrobial peptide transport system permease subunit